MQKLTKTFTNQHKKISKSKSLKANSESLSVNLKTY